MKKVFISQPMNGLSDLQIAKDRARVIEGLYDEGYKPDEIKVIDSFIEENAPEVQMCKRIWNILYLRGLNHEKVRMGND